MKIKENDSLRLHVNICARNTLLLFIVLLPCELYSNEVLTLNAAISYPLSNKNQQGFVDVFIREALLRIGYGMISVQLPADRALINANSGIDDGDLFRVSGLKKFYPNLLQVPEKILDFEFVVFTKNKNFKLNGWGSFDDISVGVIIEWKILKKTYLL